MTENILINIMERNKKIIIAICDESLLGKKYVDKEICLDLIRYRSFYEGKKLEDIKDIDHKLRIASSINIVGKKSIEFIKEKGFDVKNCIYIGKEKIPHLQIYRI